MFMVYTTVQHENNVQTKKYLKANEVKRAKKTHRRKSTTFSLFN